jgi:hypothetical protein
MKMSPQESLDYLYEDFTNHMLNNYQRRSMKGSKNSYLRTEAKLTVALLYNEIAG